MMPDPKVPLSQWSRDDLEAEVARLRRRVNSDLEILGDANVRMQRLRAVAQAAADLGLGFFNDGTGDHDERFDRGTSTHVTFHPAPPGFAMHIPLKPSAYVDNERLFVVSKALRKSLAVLGDSHQSET